MKNILNFRKLINLYDGFIFDQFGVIHDGVVINPEIEQVIRIRTGETGDKAI